MLTFLTFAIAKFEKSKFRICSNEIEIFQSTFESTKSETKSQQSTFATEDKQSIITIKFHEISLVL